MDSRPPCWESIVYPNRVECRYVCIDMLGDYHVVPRYTYAGAWSASSRGLCQIKVAQYVISTQFCRILVGDTKRVNGIVSDVFYTTETCWHWYNVNTCGARCSMISAFFKAIALSVNRDGYTRGGPHLVSNRISAETRFFATHVNFTYTLLNNYVIRCSAISLQ